MKPEKFSRNTREAIDGSGIGRAHSVRLSIFDPCSGCQPDFFEANWAKLIEMQIVNNVNQPAGGLQQVVMGGTL